MNSLVYAIITLLGWGTWLAPSQKVNFPNQQIKTLYVVITNLVIAAVVAFWRGGIGEVTPGMFWLTVLGGIIWALGGWCAFTATNKLGIAKAFGIWAPLNIVVSLLWGAALFHEFLNISPASILLLVIAILTILAGVLLIIFAKGRGDPVDSSGALQLGIAGAVGAGVFWGSYFIPVKYSGVSPWAGAFPLAIGMAVGGVLLALFSRGSWKLNGLGDYARAGLTAALWSLGNYGALLLVDAIGAGKGFTIAQISVVISALIGIYWLREPPPGTRVANRTLAGCVLAMVGGIVLGNLR
jgi:glucose uptake protein